MNTVPASFSRSLDFLDGEKFLGCWHGAYLPKGADKKFVLFLKMPQGPPWRPDASRQVLVLTNVRLRYVGETGVILTIPLGTVTDVALDRDARLFDQILTLEVTRLAPQPDPGNALVPFPGERTVSFMMVDREGIDACFERVSDAADAATKAVTGYEEMAAPAPRGSGGASRPPNDPDSFIRFHAEDEP